VQAFSIDDSATTEIDDALSVQGLGSGTVVLGIHIAAPGLAIAPDSALDKVARERLSTVYMPGWKITMLPDAVVQAYTLTEGPRLPGGEPVHPLRRGHAEGCGTETRIERVPIAANLRHDQLDDVITEASLTGEAVADYPSRPSWPSPSAWPGAQGPARAGARQARDLQPARLQLPAGAVRRTAGEPDGDEDGADHHAAARRAAGPDRGRGHDPGQQHTGAAGWPSTACPASTAARPAWLPGIKVRMGTKPLPHAGMGVRAVRLGHLAAAALRRPRQPVADHRLCPPWPHRRAGGALPAKDARCSRSSRPSTPPTPPTTTSSTAIERFWTLRWLQQQGRGRARSRGHEGRPGACRAAAAGLPRAGHRGPAARHRVRASASTAWTC
jgi:exoribonuclease-2